MKTAIAQIDSVVGDVAANGDAIVGYIHQAASEGCEVVVFPEMSDAGYDMPHVVRCATSLSEGIVPRLSAAARQHGIAVICGVSERSGENVYNTIVVIARGGEVTATYRKIHLITAAPIFEQNYVTAGTELCIFTLGEFRCGLMTCYDIRFPELARTLAVKGVEVLFVPAAFPHSRIHHWKTITECRAIENQQYVVACNRTGIDAGVRFGGCSRIISPSGELTTAFDEDTTGLATAEISRTELRGVRNGLQIWQDRRPELYEAWRRSDDSS